MLSILSFLIKPIVWIAMRFADISFKSKLMLLLAIPLLGFIWMTVASFVQHWSNYHEMQNINQLTELAVVSNKLVHEIQKERGLTAGYLGAKGNAFGEQLTTQRQQLDATQQQRAQYLQQTHQFPAKINALNQQIERALANLAQVRQQVSNQAIELAKALAFYTQLNNQLLSVSANAAKFSKDADIVQRLTAFDQFSQAKERAGIERAVLSNVFVKQQFSGDLFTKFITLVAQQNSYFASFNALTDDAAKQYAQQQLAIPAVTEVERLRNLAMQQANTGNFGVEASHWFEQATKRIGQLKQIENYLSDNLLQQVARAQQQAFNALWQSTLFGSLLIVISITLCVYSVRELHQQVTELKEVMHQVSDEHVLSARIENPSQDELGQVASALNTTLANFSSIMTDITRSSEQLASESLQTSKTCEHNLDALTDQRDEISVIATAIEQLSATVKEVASNTQNVADSAQHTNEQANSGLAVVQQSYHAIETLAHEIHQLASTITKLHESSSSITSVVDVIKSVAEQTNLLALNAAIEAARAGDQGRGFAVVADEVRTLAQRTQDSTAEIENHINALISDANNAFNVIEQSQQQANHAVAKAKDVEHSLVDITQSVATISSMTEQVAVAVEEQATVTQDVAQNVVNIEQKAVDTTTGAAQIATTAKDQSSLAQQLKQLAETYLT